MTDLSQPLSEARMREILAEAYGLPFETVGYAGWMANPLKAVDRAIREAIAIDRASDARVAEAVAAEREACAAITAAVAAQFETPRPGIGVSAWYADIAAEFRKAETAIRSRTTQAAKREVQP